MGTVISFSHFLPLVCLPFSGEGKSAKSMGCEDLEDQIRMLHSSVHVYGHSHYRTVEEHGGVMFCNNSQGFHGLEVEHEQRGPLLCVFDGERGIIDKSANSF